MFDAKLGMDPLGQALFTEASVASSAARSSNNSIRLSSLELPIAENRRDLYVLVKILRDLASKRRTIPLIFNQL